jgi:disulfide bond formation protein DsbB
VALAIGVIVVWLGLGLTYLFIALLATLVALPMLLFGPTEVYARLILGVLALSAAFTALMQALRVLLGGPGAVMGVARNMLTEAVRMKISLVSSSC